MASSPSQLRQLTLTALRGIRRDMSAAEWLRSLADKPAEVRREAAFAMLEVAQAILAIENGKLDKIALALKENEAALLAGRAELDRARKRLGRTEAVLAATAKLLDVIARIVRLPAALS